jgi:hypothetical protein
LGAVQSAQISNGSVETLCSINSLLAPFTMGASKFTIPNGAGDGYLWRKFFGLKNLPGQFLKLAAIIEWIDYMWQDPKMSWIDGINTKIDNTNKLFQDSVKLLTVLETPTGQCSANAITNQNDSSSITTAGTSACSQVAYK